MSNSSQKPQTIGKLRLPHPHLTTYNIVAAQTSSDGEQWLQLHEIQDKPGSASVLNLRNNALSFTSPQLDSGALPPLSNNMPWARSRRAPLSVFKWNSPSPPTPGQMWLAVYAIFTVQPETETFRVTLDGAATNHIKSCLRESMLAIDHPTSETDPQTAYDEIIILRSAFWQGAGSPFGAHSPWTPPPPSSTPSVEPVLYTLTTQFPDSRVHIRHPRRRPKPTPGSIVYSRYIASLDTTFSLIALDYTNESHLHLFHTWQNDPRVAAGWNETGSLDHHREYLRKQHNDPHTLTVLGRFDDTPFSYFEIFWAREDHVGAHYDAGAYDRGRHTIVGDDRFRGHALAWWPSVIHYCFLDCARTEWVVGEPIATNNKVMVYDYTFGLNVEQVIDFPHKRAALVKVSRERFFQLCPLHQKGGFLAGTGVPLPSKI